MPPKVKTSRKDIISASLGIIRENGAQALNARAIAARLGCSTQPLFSNFESMEQLEQDTIGAAYDLYLGFIAREVKSGKYPRYKAFGMAYIRFAYEERELFKLLFMRDRRGEELPPSPDFEEAVRMMMSANGIDEQTARLMHTEVWICVHGIGTMLATSFLNFDWDDISDMITDVYQGLRARHLGEAKNK
ncbi:MAG: TetR/AcrR family transcriptional regulator [Clostridia bacterium]|nr:TetR/AcrR family transcriptional regulator [Clostridia bacterium]